MSLLLLAPHLHPGLDNVGLFRVSGSVRVVERLRMQFELTGDVDLEGENDVAATAGLLRVFLRDLPDTLVPEKLTPRFFNIVQGDLERDETLVELKKALDLLPEENYNVLKYIASLLVVVADNEAENKMTAYSLAILFGPNVFRYELTSGMGGLRDMDSSKEVMQLFISHYSILFAEEDEPTPKQFWDKSQKRKSPPPRPPPPKVQSMPSFQTQSLDSDGPPVSLLTTSSSTSSLDYRPVPSPRKIKNVLQVTRSLDRDRADSPSLASAHTHSMSIPLFSPREDLDHNRAHSPFTLESETHSIIESPMITARTNEFVEKTIVQTISEHIFGSMDFNQNSGPLSPNYFNRIADVDNLDGTPVDLPVARPRQTLASKAMTAGNSSNTSSSHQGSRDSQKTPTLDNHISQDFDEVERMDMLTGHKKPCGPPRRTPSRKHRLSSREEDPLDSERQRPGVPSVRTSVGKNQARLSNQFHGLNHSSQGGGSGSPSSGRNKENIGGGRDWSEGYPEAADSLSTLTGGNGEGSSSNNSSTPHTKDPELCSPTSNTAAPLGKARSSARKNEDRALTPQSLSMLNSQESSSTTATIQSPSSTSPTPASNGLVERSPTNGIKLFIPPLDFSTLHEHVDGSEPIPVSKGQFDTQIWIKTNQLTGPEESNVAIISPRSHKLKKRNGIDVLAASLSVDTEAPMSPSANSNCGIFRASTNTDIPPSPPIQQDIYKKHSDDECSYRLRQLTKKISGLKKKIKSFEEAFERQHGYKPSQGEKAAQLDIKKYMNELSKARKDLKSLKETTEKSTRSRHNSGASSSGVEPSPPATPTVSSTLDFILKCLLNKRREAGRPEEVSLMTREQVHEEKLAVQRALLHFEGLHGRPSTRDEKDLMRPLYDRYRSVKRMLAKPVSPRNSLELQTVPEDQMIEIPRYFTQRNAIRIPTALESDGDNFGQPDTGNSLDVGSARASSGWSSRGIPAPSTPTSAGGGEFGLVTQDLGLLREIEQEITEGHSKLRAADEQEEDEEGDEEGGEGGSVEGGSGRPEDGGGSGEGNEDSGGGGGEANLHELSLTELHAEIEVSRGKKKRLRRVLKHFEEEFLDFHGRKVQKEDRYPLQSEYSQYKKVKARLRLLEALVLKHHE
ncbi:protein fam13b-like isoform x2 [Plakobranchus ocellatus]|uniref:Protein fam13b-like isoform x2 n=1 Tax=Plakobranchus ocellatus TaxID=259542 RepID=A0AAV4BS91_9GAST|nr:protein fam13b-like isoform x2 [Plakobranchus ocellatus]